MAAGAKRLRGGIGGAPATTALLIVPGQSDPQDVRAAEIARAGRDAAQWREQTRAVLEDQGSQLDEDRLDQVVSSLRNLDVAAEDGRTWILETGRELLKLQELVGPGGYKALVRAGLVSISEATASRLRKIAQRVAERGINTQLLPREIKPAYAVVSVPPAYFERVAERVSLGPHTSVRAIQEAVAAVRAEAAATEIPQAPQERREKLEREIAKLEKQRDEQINKLRQRFAVRIEAARAELDALPV